MELAGAPYLFNLSLMALTFATVSALVMLLRQTMGGKLSNFDIYLISAYISFGFSDALTAIFPALIALFDPSQPLLWALAGLGGAALIGGFEIVVLRSRRLAAAGHIPVGQLTAFGIRGAGVLLLIFNAIPTPFQGAGFFALGVTLSFVGLMWGFVRRVSSLLGDRATEDWDPNRG